MNSDRDYGEALKVGYSGDEPWDAMQRSGQRIVFFRVAFEELNSDPETRDYRGLLNQIWLPLFNEAGLSASILHESWHPDRGPDRKVVGFVWRQQGTEALGNVSETELFRLSDLLRASDSGVTGFVLTEQFTTLARGNHRSQRKLRLSRGDFFIEPHPEDQSVHTSSPETAAPNKMRLDNPLTRPESE